MQNYVFMAVMVKIMLNLVENYAASAANGNWASIMETMTRE